MEVKSGMAESVMRMIAAPPASRATLPAPGYNLPGGREPDTGRANGLSQTAFSRYGGFPGNGLVFDPAWGISVPVAS
jgi:hypothetical protein